MHFITGGTGFVGSAIILELLQQTNHMIYCLVRPRPNLSGTKRLHTLLQQLITKYNYPSSLQDKVSTHCQVIEGDLTDPDLVERIYLPKDSIKEFWHIAASLKFENRFKEEIFELNVGGTIRMLALAQKLKVTTFNHFSTAYVAGKKTGRIHEVAIHNIETNNLYELSKIEGEHLVLNSTAFHTRIFRPSIVIGHSKTKYAINCSGLYGFHRKIYKFKHLMEKVQQDYFQYHTPQLQVIPDATPNFIPIDVVSKQATNVVLRYSPSSIYHLTNPFDITTKKVVDTIFALTQIPGLIYVKNSTDFNYTDQKLNEHLDFYLSYLNGKKTFDRTNINTAIGQNTFDTFPVMSHNIQDYCKWYATQLAQTAKPKVVFR